jgi:hypothetical protein
VIFLFGGKAAIFPAVCRASRITSKNHLKGDFLPCKLLSGFSQAALAAREPQ